MINQLKKYKCWEEFVEWMRVQYGLSGIGSTENLLIMWDERPEFRHHINGFVVEWLDSKDLYVLPNFVDTLYESSWVCRINSSNNFHKMILRDEDGKYTNFNTRQLATEAGIKQGFEILEESKK